MCTHLSIPDLLTLQGPVPESRCSENPDFVHLEMKENCRFFSSSSRKLTEMKPNVFKVSKPNSEIQIFFLISG